MHTVLRFRLVPTQAQEKKLRHATGARRWVWNWALARQKAAYSTTGKSESWKNLSAELTQLKHQPDTAWLAEADSQSLQQALKDLQKAYSAFFTGLKAKRRVGSPKFRSKHDSHQSFRTPQSARVDAKFVTLPKLGRIKARVSHDSQGLDTKSCTVTKDALGHWHASFVVDIGEAQPKLPIDPAKAVGVDLGLSSLATLSDGEIIESPRWYKKAQLKIRKAAKSLSRKTKGSARRLLAKRRLACVHAKLSAKRLDFLHKLSTGWVKKYDLIGLEDLSIKGLARTKLAKSVLDAGWGLLRQMVEYKAERAGKTIVLVNRFFPSTQLCSACGELTKLSLSQREWVCPCGQVHDRDLNAAKNIEAYALRAAGQADLNARGADVRPTQVG